jgi:hypothetical protein
MRHFIGILLSLCCSWQVQAQPFSSFPPGMFENRAALDSASASYTGPGDIQSYTFWCGFRAYNAATAGTKAIRVVRASDSTQQDINTLANGNLDAATLTTFLTSTTGKVVTCYDKAGTNDVTQSTDANRPAVTANALGTSYCMTFTGTTALISGSNENVSQPYFFSAIANKTAGDSDRGIVSINNSSYGGATTQFQTANPFNIYAGTSVNSGALSLSTWYALQALLSGASSINRVNGTEVGPSNAGSQATGANPIVLGADYSTQLTATLQGLMCEAGFVAGTVGGTTRTSLNTNMRAAYGGF